MRTNQVGVSGEEDDTEDIAEITRVHSRAINNSRPSVIFRAMALLAHNATCSAIMA